MKPTVTIVNANTDVVEIREMTDDEYQQLLETGWTPDPEVTE